MSRYHSYLNTARVILQQYKGEEPFAPFLKKFFSGNKKYGSKDRKMISHLCYCYFRMGKAGMDLPAEERLLQAMFLCAEQSNELLLELRPEWTGMIGSTTKEKVSMLNAECSTLNVFPWKDELSGGIDHERFCESFFIQPDLFLRLRPGHEAIVKKKLKDAGITYGIIADSCLALANASKIDTIIELNKEAVVQDYSSQRTGEYFLRVRRGPSDTVWDCCAGSGGKSIMLYDLDPGINLTVSDVRDSIIRNLRQRFKESGIKNYKAAVVDLVSPGFEFPAPGFDLILCDAPCTGSGTWSRTPEQLFYFEKEKIGQYTSLQKRILTSVVPYLRDGGYLFYITCSVFKKENEEAVEFLKQQFHLQLIQMEVLEGYEKKADTMFVALLQKTS